MPSHLTDHFYEDAPVYTHLRTTTRRARRAYKCGLCPHEIAAGSRYVEQVGVLDGEILVQRSHDDQRSPEPCSGACQPCTDALWAQTGG